MIFLSLVVFLSANFRKFLKNRIVKVYYSYPIHILAVPREYLPREMSDSIVLLYQNRASLPQYTRYWQITMVSHMICPHTSRPYIFPLPHNIFCLLVAFEVGK